MSRSIVYAGCDLSDWTVAEWSRPAGHAMAVDAAEAPGRPGVAWVSSRVAPLEIRVRLFLEMPNPNPAADPGYYRRKVAAALFSGEPAELELPGDDGIVYRDVVCADASGWSNLFTDGSCELVFVALDPIAWGAEDGFGPIAVAGAGSGAASGGAGAADAGGSGADGAGPGALGTGVTLDYVPGSAPTWPVFELVAAAGGAVEVQGAAGGEPFVRVERQFEGGEEVVIDCGAGRAWVDGEAADADVALGSTFFQIAPGGAQMGFAGVSSYAASYFARWY